MRTRPPLKLSRLFRPRDPRFWLMIALNLLSAVLAWVLRTYPLVPLATALMAVFALGNALLGMRIAFDLLRDKRIGAAGAARRDHDPS
ncbi:hypothetical protein SAMN05216242_11920 [Thauera chlorobenzoica]|uniref:Uncharacterized protein n=2 Tax=Thauera chlorobenzoica TaxID=96773 RepID=A0A1H5XQB4_9RHOO|nr:hypothetical protein Tchl_2465 [Thauera chlorobenzoica]SEG13456.1 hypothetical protein SAMN05216242_11920 [Thauera chlorobenzoica]